MAKFKLAFKAIDDAFESIRTQVTLEEYTIARKLACQFVRSDDVIAIEFDTNATFNPACVLRRY